MDDPNCDQKGRVERERSIALSVSHPNVVKTYGYFTLNTPPPGIYNDDRQHSCQLVLVMKKADMNLKQYLRSHPDLSYPERKEIIVKIAEGLVYLYNQFICVHDIKVGFVRTDRMVFLPLHLHLHFIFQSSQIITF